MDENKKADIIVSESFYHYNWLVRKNNVVIGEFNIGWFQFRAMCDALECPVITKLPR